MHKKQHGLRFEVFDSSLELASDVATAIQNQIRHKPSSSVSFPTGSTMLPTYEILREMALRGEFSLAQAQVFLLDEYVGLPKDSPDSYLEFITNQIQEPCGLPKTSLNYPDVHAEDLDEASAAYELKINGIGGMDLQILGIGSNGHVGFNEPGSSFLSQTRVTQLSLETRRDNSKYFKGDLNTVPERCITQGLATITSAKKILLVATGGSKAWAISELLGGDRTESLPASVLLSHPDVTLFLDAEAASLIRS
jgi:glucosamine-6-phosphate deaminase